MISLTTLIIAGLLLAALIAAAFLLPHPATLLAAFAAGLILFVFLLPRYQGQQQALANGETVTATVSQVRWWSRKTGDGDYIDQYEIIAFAPHPQTGEIRKFVSPPLRDNPEPHLNGSVEVKVDWRNPQAYVMDLDFLPQPPK